MKKLLSFSILMFLVSLLFGQVGINETGASPDGSAILDVSSSDKGLLIPRMDNTEMNGITTPANGLMVFNTTDNCFYFRITSGWKKLISETNNHGVSDSDGDSYLSFRQPSTDDDTLRIFFDNVERYKISSRAIEVLNNQGSVFIGQGAGKLSTTAVSNVAVGSAALYHNTYPGSLVAVGDGALFNNGRSIAGESQGTENVAIGSKALFTNNTGRANTATGNKALYYNDSGDNNAAYGNFSLYNNAAGSNNSAFGSHSLLSNSSGTDNTAIGSVALFKNSTGNHNTTVGSEALFNNLSGFSNVAVGKSALLWNTTRSNLVAVGDNALYHNGKEGVSEEYHATANTAIGSKVLYSNTSGYNNTSVGFNSQYLNTTGYDNTSLGTSALYTNTTGVENTAIGSLALYSNTSGLSNTAIGKVAMNYNTTGSLNTAVGNAALFSNTTGEGNAAFGTNALLNNVSGNYNTAVGYAALQQNTSGGNTALGYAALSLNEGGWNNTAVGMNSGQIISSGIHNITLGYHAGKNITTGSYNIIIGDYLDAPSATASYQMVLGAADMLYGDITNKRIGIGTTTPTAILHAYGIGTGGGNVLFTGQRKISGAGDPPASGAGTRLMWYPDQAAFRAGGVEGTQWDKASLGSYSAALGFGTKASAASCIALGHSTSATNDFATAMGVNSTASGHSSTAMGVNSTASGHSSTAMGSYTSALSFVETVVGQYNTTYTPNNVNAWHSSDRLFVVANGTEHTARSNAMTILKNGNIGIGTSTPATQLHTTGSVRFGNLAAISQTQAVMTDDSGNLSKRTLNTVAFNGYTETDPTWTGSANTSGPISRTGHVGIGANATAPKCLLSIGDDGVGLNRPLLNVLTFHTAEEERMVIYSDGKVGIGAATPSYLLSLGANTTGLHYPATNTLSINTNGSERMRISNTGNIGIGTNSPGQLLHLRNTSGSAKMRVQSTNVSEIEFFNNTAYVGAIGINVSEGHLYLYQGGSVSVKGGSLGIGNIDPGHKLDITAGHGRVQSGYSWLTNSDIRYKQNITTLENSLQKISKIRGVRYDLKEEEQLVAGKGKHIGFIAQELEKEFPEFVVTEENGYKSVSYDKMTAVLVEAVKEQQTEIDELKKIVQKQQAQISALLEISAQKTASK